MDEYEGKTEIDEISYGEEVINIEKNDSEMLHFEEEIIISKIS